MVITRGKGGWWEVGEGKWGINSDGRLDLGWRTQNTDDVYRIVHLKLV